MLAAINASSYFLSMSEDCCCASLADLAVVPQGGDGLDERVFASLEQVAEHGGGQWWLYLSFCRVCAQNWMIAQDDRIYDNYYLRRVSPITRQGIVERETWPDELITYEQVLRLGRTLSQPWTFLDPKSPSLIWTVEDLRNERPDISIEEIAYLLAISIAAAVDLDA